MKIAAIYARVSTQRQAEEATIASQIDQLEQFANQNSYHIPPEYRFIDEAVSGKSLHRPALTRLRDSAMTGEIATILCLSPDRLSRNLGIQQLLTAEWQQMNVTLIFVHHPPSGNMAHDQMLLNLQGVFAEYKRTVISDRMQRGRRYKLRQGHSVPWPAPYGYDYVRAIEQSGSRWEVNLVQAAVVKQIFAWYTQDDLTTYGIAVHLNEQQIAGPEGGEWQATTVSRILYQSGYRGIAYYGRKQQDFSGVGQPRKQGNGRLERPRYQQRPVDEWIEVAVPPLVDEKIWQQAQEKRHMNQQNAQRNSRRAYLLRGLLVCAICGHTLQGRAQGGHTYYRCSHGGKQRSVGVPAHTCTIRGDMAEAQVWAALTDLLRQPEQIEAAWKTQQETEQQPASQLSRWRQRQRELETQSRRLLDAYQNGVIELEELTNRRNPLLTELQTLQTRLAVAEKAAAVELSLEQFTTRIEEALQATDMETRQEVIRLLIEQIVVEDDALIVHHIVPTTDNSQLKHTLCET
ncbi:MAG: recombinase family protein [Anaerolinea sp.]|nr:recombinase family protein [Anaerolinea sp.]